MDRSLIASKIIYNNCIKQLEVDSSNITYSEPVHHSSSSYYIELAESFEKLHYDCPINYRRIYKFLFIDVWNKQP
jgi:hypothetical protein